MKHYINSAVLLVALFALSCGRNTLEQDRKAQEYRKAITILENQYESQYWIDRRNALASASVYPYSRTEKLLRKGLSDRHPKVRIEAIRSLALFPTAETKDTLSGLAQSDPDYTIRLESIQVLATFKSPQLAGVFMSAVDDANWMIREAGARGLLEIDHTKIRRIQDDYVLRLLSDSDMNVRMTALASLHFTNSAIYAFLKSEILDPKNKTKIYYQIALTKALEGYILDNELQKLLKGYLVGLNPDLRVQALRTLKKSRDLSEK